MHEDFFLEGVRGDDFLGVQAYSRTRVGPDGLPLGPEPGVEMLEPMGYEYWPAGARGVDPPRGRGRADAAST